ncbi:MAG: cupredoxin domain-containing protein [Candidatus Limnocylindrales bacterium]
MDQIWNAFLDLMARFVTPDWGALIGLIPIAILALVVMFIAWLLWRATSLGPTRRGKGRLPPRPPTGVHLPGPSFAPLFGAVGTALLLFGLVFGGLVLYLGLAALVLTLLYWGAEAMRDYDRATAAQSSLPAVIHPGPPPGVHMPGPSFRPVVAAIALTVLMFGLVFGGWLLAVGLLMLVISLVGWLRDARAEYVLAERADAIGHLEAMPAPRVPTGTFALFGALFVLGVILNSGLIPPGSASGATGASAAPAGSGGPGGSAAPGPSLPAADVTVTAKNIKFDTASLSATADKGLTIAFVNEDQGVPHDIEIADGSGAILFEGETINGVATTVYAVPPLKTGTYKFLCKWHPTMVGELTVE